MEYIKDLHELCETISEEIADQNDKIRKAGGKMSAGDLEVIDKLTHALKSIKATIAMVEAEDEYSSAYEGGMGNRVYRGGSYRYSRSYRDDGSYARGRNARRDSMGRYSRAEDNMSEIVDELRGMMDSLPEEKKAVVRRFVDKVDQM